MIGDGMHDRDRTHVALIAKTLTTLGAQLEDLPSTPDVERLRDGLASCEGKLARWTTQPPQRAERETMKARVTELTVAVVRTRRMLATDDG